MRLSWECRARFENIARKIDKSALETLAIYGAGGFGKETKFLLESINRAQPRFHFKGFIDDNVTQMPLAEPGSFRSLSIAIASPVIRRKIYAKAGANFEYPNLIHPDVFIDESCSLGRGLILCAGVQMTVDITLGDFVIVNLNATIGHDTRIGAFSSLMPSVNISGNVRVGEGVFIGSGATVLQGLTIGDGAVIGAGSVVTRNIPPGVVAKGVPARWQPL